MEGFYRKEHGTRELLAKRKRIIFRPGQLLLGERDRGFLSRHLSLLSVGDEEGTK